MRKRLCLQEHFGVYAGFPENGTEGAFGHVARMVWQSDLTARCGLAPDLVTAGTGPVKNITADAQFMRDL